MSHATAERARIIFLRSDKVLSSLGYLFLPDCEIHAKRFNPITVKTSATRFQKWPTNEQY